MKTENGQFGMVFAGLTLLSFCLLGIASGDAKAIPLFLSIGGSLATFISFRKAYKEIKVSDSSSDTFPKNDI